MKFFLRLYLILRIQQGICIFSMIELFYKFDYKLYSYIGLSVGTIVTILVSKILLDIQSNIDIYMSALEIDRKRLTVQARELEANLSGRAKK